MSDLPRSISVAAAGMACSLGHDVVTACAAARAGLARPSPLPEFVIGAYGEPEPVSGHVVTALTEGFHGDARLLRLLVAALQDAVARFPAIATAGGRLHVFVAFPASDRTGLALERIEDDSLLKELQDAAAAGRCRDELARTRQLVTRAWGMLGLPASGLQVSTTVSGRSGVVELLQQAAEVLAAGQCELALVGGVDCMTGPEMLRWHSAQGRLKSPAQPVGLMPGEAAALLLLVCPTLPNQGGLGSDGPAAKLCAVAQHDGPTSQWAHDAPRGEGLSAVVAQVYGERAAPPWLVADHNGEEFRAAEWGVAWVRLSARFEAFRAASIWLPAVSLGDCGVAAAAVALCIMVRAFERGYTPAQGPGIVVVSSDGPERCALLLEGVGRDGR